MYNISIKYKRSIIIVFKLVIVTAALFFLYHKLVHNQQLKFNLFLQQLSVLGTYNIWIILLLLFLTDINWFLEIFKWKTLVSVEKKITFLEAYEQCLGSLTASLITPNRIGEYGAKALYFKKKQRKKIVVLNLIGNLFQLSATIFFGILGILFILFKFSFKIPLINIYKTLLVFALILILILLIKQLVLNFIESYLKKIKLYFNKISNKVIMATLLYSMLRYLVFSHQFYFLLRLFGVEVPYFTAITLIFAMYFIASIIPSLSLFDWAIKGSVALTIFSLIPVTNLTIITITTLMWLLNFAIPAIIGSFFVLNFKIPLET
jgi:uncharacterized membrane protein YbhN (UPF0104 family)